MELGEFPRPTNDSGRGVHWSLSPYWKSAGADDWLFWERQIKEMNLRWIKVVDDMGGSAWKLVMRLLDIGVMPVVRLYTPEQNPGNIGARGGDTVKRYVKEGAVYFESNNEPDLALEWVGGIRPENWLEQVVDGFIIDADIVLGLGGYISMPAFGVGTLRNPYELVVDKGRQDILDNGAFASLHNYCLGRPLSYPNDEVNLHGKPLEEGEWEEAGGMVAWEMGPEAVNEARMRDKNPDASIMTDSTCFRAFEHLNQIIVGACGHSIPVMTTEGGYNVGQRAGTTFGDDARFPKPTPYHASRLNLEMFNFMDGTGTILGQRVPDYYFACMPWLIAAYRIHAYAAPAENQGPWFSHLYDQDWGLDGELPLVQMLKDQPGRVRQSGPVPAPWLVERESDALGDAWDSRLDWLGVEYVPYEPAIGLAWRLVGARWLDEEEAGGQCSIFVKALDEDGTPLEGMGFVVLRDGGTDVIETKGEVDGYWGNYAMYGGLGTYTVSMCDISEAVTGVGFGVEEPPHAPAPTSFRFVFQLARRPEPSSALEQLLEQMERWARWLVRMLAGK